MPNHTYWRALSPSEESDIIVLLGRPWIQNSHAQEIAQDDQIDVLYAMDVSMGDITNIPLPEAYPPHIIDAVLDHAETTKKICPITMEPIQKQTATLTRCGHIFQKSALTAWLKSKSSCPECRANLSACQ
jgi:predicted Zn-ribbon and HTH transcriptional regulator